MAAIETGIEAPLLQGSGFQWETGGKQHGKHASRRAGQDSVHHALNITAYT